MIGTSVASIVAKQVVVVAGEGDRGCDCDKAPAIYTVDGSVSILGRPSARYFDS